jgi:hypothetical protein
MKYTNPEHERYTQKHRIRDDPWVYLMLIGWISLGIFVLDEHLTFYVQLGIWILAMSCFVAASIISTRRISPLRRQLKLYKLLSSATDTMDPDVITAACLTAQTDSKFIADPYLKVIIEKGLALADELREEIKNGIGRRIAMNRNTAERLFEDAQAIFTRHGERAIPSGWSLSGEGLYFFEFHMRQKLFGSKRTSGKIFEEIRDLTNSNGLNLIGSGMGYIGNRWWFFHFHFLEAQRDAQHT